eukprot:GHUV01012643.1.p1 GENE.GHUV01012643.1~~GHUV01012643.1.p1  ORF type:complete len:1562 (+),score=569.41 GHUV01012643.1:165-4850(+)
MSQTLYRELHPATAVTHCVDAYFTQAAGGGNEAFTTAPNVVIARGARIEVYSLNYGLAGPPAPGSSAVPHCRLELVGSWQCWGVVQDMAVLRGRGNSGQRDSIIIAVRDAKVAVIEWDDQLHCLRTGSLHSFEGDPSLRDGCPCGSSGIILPAPPKVAADPLGRCAAALVYGKHLAILPAIQADLLETLLQEGASAKGSRTSASVGNSYLVNLAKMPTIKLASDTSVRGMTFLHGYTEPVLLLLHESTPTWGGRLRDVRDTCCLSAMSINIRKKRQPVIWSVHHLPSDCSRVMAVPRGGVLVLSQNLLLYYAQGGSCVMAINSNAFAGEVPPRLDPIVPPQPSMPPRTQAEQQQVAAAAAEKAAAAATAYAKQWATNVHPETVAAAAKAAPKAPGMELQADGAVGCWIANNIALLSLKTGQLLLVALKFEAAAASKMQVVIAGSAPVASCAATLTSNLLFLGSCVGDSLLVRYTPELSSTGSTAATASGGVERIPSGIGSSENPAKRRKLSSLASFEMGGGLEGDLELGIRPSGVADGLYLDDGTEVLRSALGRSQSSVVPVQLLEGAKHSFKVLDSLMCLGPIRSTDIASLHLRESDVHASLSGESPQHDPSQCVIAAVGSDKSGALAIMRRGVVADVITAVPGLEAHGAWTLHYREPKGFGIDADVVNDNIHAGVDPIEGDTHEDLDKGDRHHAFLLLSCRGESTMVLDARGQELAEITDQVAYIRDAPTIAVGELFNATAAVQVTHSTVRLVSGSSFCLQDIPLSELLLEANHPAAVDDANVQICIKYAQIRDPYVVLLLSDHQATALLLQGDAKQQRLVLLTAALRDLAEAGWEDAAAAVTAVCLYTDTTGWVAAAAGLAASEEQQQQSGTAVGLQGPAGAGQQQQQGIADDEDALMAEAAAEAPAAGEPYATTAAEAAGNAHGLVQEQQHVEQKSKKGHGDPLGAEASPNNASADAGVGFEPKRTFKVPDSDAEAAGVLEGVEGTDAAMAEAAADHDPQEADKAAAAPAASIAAAGEAGDPAVAAEGGEQANEPGQQHASAADAAVHQAVQQQQQLPQQQPARQTQTWQRRPPMSFCCVARAGGSMELYALPDMTCVFQEVEATLGHQVMTPARPESPYAESVADEDLQPSTISEVMLECFTGASGAALGVPAAVAPLLVMLRDDGSCLIYKAFKAASANSLLGFRRQPLDPAFLCRQSPAALPDATAAAAPAPGMPLPSAPPCRLVRFDHLVTPRLEPPLGPGILGLGSSGSNGHGASSGLQGLKLRYSGIFVCGPKPIWLVASRGALVPHPMDGKVGMVDAFCAFHNPSCQHGYIAASLTGDMNICTLPLQMRLDQPWLTCKWPLRATPQALVHYPEARLIAIATARLAAPPRPYLPADPGGDAVAAAAYATAEAATKAAGVEDLNEVQLLAPPGCGLPMSSYTGVAAAVRAAAAAAAGGTAASSSGSQGLISLPSIGSSGAGTAGAAAGSSAKVAAAIAAAAGWVGLPMWRYSLLPGEQVLCLKNVALCEGGDESANPEPFIAVGCASAFGEDYPALGRVLLFQVCLLAVKEL